MVRRLFVITGIAAKLNRSEAHLVDKDKDELNRAFESDDEEDFLHFTKAEIAQTMVE